MRATQSKIPPSHPGWEQLLAEAVAKPGVISAAYRRFWNYSFQNQLLAAFECMQRGIDLGPIHTFRGWLEVGRHVKKGEKAITLCMPVQIKRKSKDDTSPKSECSANPDSGSAEPASPNSGMRTIFVFKPNWFVLSQTDGADYTPTEAPAWSESLALSNLNITRQPFRHPDGNCQGYASKRTVAVSPVAALPHKTLFHEIAHVTLEHTAESTLDDHEHTPRNLREVEAEATALICCESLGLAGAAECRGYIQHWLKHGQIPERSAQHIFRAADQILKAGRPIEPPAETLALNHLQSSNHPESSFSQGASHG